MTTDAIQRTILYLLFFLIPSAHAQVFGGGENVLTAQIYFSVDKLARQQSYTCLIEIKINPEWHINSHTPLGDFLIPTELSFEPVEGITYGRTRYMPPKLRTFSFSESEVSVYDNTTYIQTTVTVTPDLAADRVEFKANLTYQACNDYSCLPPASTTLIASMPIIDNSDDAAEINGPLFDSAMPYFEESIQPAESSRLEDVIRTSGFIYALIFIYLGGLALNLTPCVYPLIPITISYFGGQSGGKKGALFLRAMLYVIGMAITYSILGVVAALSGGLLGSALQNPLVLIFVALVLTGLALSMFGLYEIRVPQSLAQIGGASRSGYIGTLLMGLTVGLIAAPCIGPFVLGLLTYVSEIGEAFTGFLMFFILALGLGTPFLLLGIFSGAAATLPRSGAWMVWVRNIFGFVLIGMAIYFLEPLFPDEAIYYYTLALVALAAGIYLGWLEKTTGSKGFKIVRYLTGLLFIVLALFLVYPSESNAETQIAWQPYDEQLLTSAAASGKPVIIDFYADWCIPCKELDKFTFNKPEIVMLSQQFITLKKDLTKFQGETNTMLRQRFNIKGVPTIVFIAAEGKEHSDLRLVGFENAENFLERMKQALP
jgi:thiol:disulfide interchange protein DsbD